MKAEKKNKRQMISKIKSAISYLKIDELDKELSKFIETNYKFYFECLTNTNISYANSNSFKITSMDNSEFKLTMIPDSVAPEKIIIELINLDGKSIQSYTINYLSNNNVKLIKRSSLMTNDLNGNTRLQKKYIEKTFKNGKLYNEKKLDNYIGDTDNNCSRETITFYPNLDDAYVKSQISIGMDDSIYPTSIRYVKYDGKEVKLISQTEFDNATINLKRDKVLTIGKKCA